MPAPRRLRLFSPEMPALARAAVLLPRLSGRAVCAAAAVLEAISEIAAIAARFLARIISSLGLPRPGRGAWPPAGLRPSVHANSLTLVPFLPFAAGIGPLSQELYMGGETPAQRLGLGWPGVLQSRPPPMPVQ